MVSDLNVPDKLKKIGQCIMITSKIPIRDKEQTRDVRKWRG
jgi:hypothetical protein